MKKRLCVTLVALILMLSVVSCQGAKETHLSNDLTSAESRFMPLFITTSYAELKDINHALLTMDKASFEEYMKEYHMDLVVGGMHDFEATQGLIDELKSTTVLLYKNDIDEPNQLSFYHERNEIHTFSVLPDGTRFTCYSYSPIFEKKGKGNLSYNESLIYEKDIFKADCSIKLYSYINEDRGFYGETHLNGSYITFWTSIKQSEEDFAKDFEELDFVKIGDVLDGTYGANELPETRTDV